MVRTVPIINLQPSGFCLIVSVPARALRAGRHARAHQQPNGKSYPVLVNGCAFNSRTASQESPWLVREHPYVSRLAGLGYKRIVFLRAECNLKINGLAVLENPDAS